jgi:Holliday junction resolvase RusA-like endonuclease
MRLSFNIPMVPVAKGRPQHTKSGFTYTPEKTEKAEDFVIHELRHQMGSCKPFAPKIPLIMVARFYKPHPQSQPPKSQPKWMDKPVQKPDWDNLAKLVCDAAEKFVYDNDSAITDARIIKRYAAPGTMPRVEMMFTEDTEP